MALTVNGYRTDTIPATGASNLAGDYLPLTDDTYDLGSASKRWAEGYFRDFVRIGVSDLIADGHIVLALDATTFESAKATAISLVADSPFIKTIGWYWNGSSASDVGVQMGALVTDDSPLTYRAGLLGLGGTELLVFTELDRPLLLGRAALSIDNVNVTAVGNVGTGEDDLITRNLAASSLVANGQGVRIKAWGTFANNADAKTLKAYFGSQLILTNSLPANLAGNWFLEAIVVRTGTDTQDYVAKLDTIGASSVAINDIEIGTATQDDGAAITIKCTGEATSNNDIVQEGLLVEFLN